MSNPWLDIPEADYIGHMSSPTVGQEVVLSRLLGEALELALPKTVLILGGSTGNGLERVNSDVTARVVVVDINPAYLRSLHERYPNPGFELDLRSGDVMDLELDRNTYDLVHAGLFFEYVDWPVLLPRVAAALKPGGALSVVLQVPSASSPAVTPTEFTSLRKLESLFHFVEPTAFLDAARDEKLNVRGRHTEALPAGKAFEVLHLVRGATDSLANRSPIKC